MISAIVATAEDGVIGKDGGLPWYLPAELAHFKELTTGHPIIMGRITHESIGRSLPGRTNIVITRDQDYKVADGSKLVSSLDSAIKLARTKGGSDEIFIIGGEQIYTEALPKIEKIYLTRVKAKVSGDKFFKYNPKDWEQTSIEKHKADDKNQHDFEFVTLQRKHS